jgi:hypothetical protein
MLSSIKAALKDFAKVNNIFVNNTRFLSKFGNIIIPKVSGLKVLTKENYHSHLGTELIQFETLCQELKISKDDLEKTFNRDYSSIFYVRNELDLRKFKTKNLIQCLNILDCILTHEGWNPKECSWHNKNNYESNLINIDKFGDFEVIAPEKSYYKKFNTVSEDSIVHTKIDTNNMIEFYQKIGIYSKIIKYLNIECNKSEEEALILLENLANLKPVIKFEIVEDFESKKYTNIIVGVELNPTKLITKKIRIDYDEFKEICSILIAKKKLLKDFAISDGIYISPLSSIKKEKIIWFNSDGKIYKYELEDAEIDALDLIIKKTFNGLHKNRAISWEKLYSLFCDVRNFYSDFENENISVPSGPDTSKFSATVSGWIKVDKDFRIGESYYTRGVYFKYGLQVGGNFKYGKPSVVMKYLLRYVQKYYGLPNYNDGGKISIISKAGTNYSVVGIG